MKQPPLQELRLRNFRCFREQQTARLAPLTLLVGENSTGKTSFLAAVRAILAVGSYHEAPDFRAPPYDLGSFREIAYRQDLSGRRGAQSFDLGFQCAGNEIDTIRLDGTFTLGDGTAPTLSSLFWNANDVWVSERRGGGETHTDVGCAGRSWRLPAPRSSDRPYLSVYGDAHAFTRPLRVAAESGMPGELEPLHGDAHAVPSECDLIKLVRLYFEINGFTSEALAGAPIRSSPLRTYDPVRLVQDPQGVSTPAFLANLHARKPDEWQDMKRDLEEFGNRSGLFDDVFVKRLGRHEFEPFQLEVRKRGKTRKGARRNLIDVGYGVSQILPLLVELFRHDRASMFLLQQPEVHLHPSAQAEIGSLFCANAAAGRQLIVETHSEYIIDRVRMDIRDRRTALDPDDISVLFFERTDIDVHIHSLRFDEQGNLLDAPDGYGRFFMDETRRSIGL